MRKIILVVIIIFIFTIGLVHAEVTKDLTKKFPVKALKAIAKKAESTKNEKSSAQATAQSSPTMVAQAPSPLSVDKKSPKSFVVEKEESCARYLYYETRDTPCCAGLNAENSENLCTDRACTRELQRPSTDQPCCSGLVRSTTNTGPDRMPTTICSRPISESGGGCADLAPTLNEILILLRRMAR